MAEEYKLKKQKFRIITFLVANDLHSIACVEWAVPYKHDKDKVDVQFEWLKCALRYLKEKNRDLASRRLVGAMYVFQQDALSLRRSRWIDDSNIALDTSTPSVRDMQYQDLNNELQREVAAYLIRTGGASIESIDPKVH